jgi:hypothetical protein
LLVAKGWQEAEPATWKWGILSINPEPTEYTLPPLKRDYRGHADSLLMHRLGGDPRRQETIRIWDSGVRLSPSNQPVYLGLAANETLVQRLKVFSYWSAVQPSRDELQQLVDELAEMEAGWRTDSLLLIRN